MTSSILSFVLESCTGFMVLTHPNPFLLASARRSRRDTSNSLGGKLSSSYRVKLSSVHATYARNPQETVRMSHSLSRTCGLSSPDFKSMDYRHMGSLGTLHVTGRLHVPIVGLTGRPDPGYVRLVGRTDCSWTAHICQSIKSMWPASWLATTRVYDSWSYVAMT